MAKITNYPKKNLPGKRPRYSGKYREFFNEVISLLESPERCISVECESHPEAIGYQGALSYVRPGKKRERKAGTALMLPEISDYKVRSSIEESGAGYIVWVWLEKK